MEITRLIIITTVIRCIIACYIDLGNDEVYYFTYAVQPDLNHFDHPPLVGLVIRLFTFNLQWINELAMRLPGIVGAAINTFLIARCGQLVRNRRTGIMAAILYNTSVYASVISGVFILPDSVQLVFWLAAVYTMLKSIDTQLPQQRNQLLMLTGLWIGLAVMSKVHGVFLWFGLLGFLFCHRPGWFKNPFLYLSMLLTALIISPILFWNINNDFITWQFHSERVTVNQQGINFKSFLTTTIGQVLYCNPAQVAIYIPVLGAVFKGYRFVNKPFLLLLLWCSFPIILCTTAISIFRDTLPHWSGPGFLGIMLISAAYIDERMSQGVAGFYKKALNAAIGLMLFVFVAGLSLVNFYPGTLGKKTFPDTGKGDATLDIYGWDELLPAFKNIREDDITKHRMSTSSPMLVHHWFPGSHMYYYVAYPLHMRVVGVGSLLNLHKFQWLNSLSGPVLPGTDAYYISPSNNFTNPAIEYGNAFESYEKAATITQKRSGQIARYWYVYRLKHATRTLGSTFQKTYP
jgi:hypothetical protein